MKKKMSINFLMLVEAMEELMKTKMRTLKTILQKVKSQAICFMMVTSLMMMKTDIYQLII